MMCLKAVLMQKFGKYLLIFLGLGILGVILWYFSNIVAYILIAGLFSLVGRPVTELLNRIRIGRFRIPRSISALLTLIILWAVIFGFFRIFVPLVANEANQLSRTNPDQIIQQFKDPFEKIKLLYYEFNTMNEDAPKFEVYIEEKVRSILSISFLSNFFASIFNILGNLFIAAFSISFITFFFLKEKHMFTNAIVLLVPAKYEEGVRNSLLSTRNLLRRYFIGIGGQITGIITLITVGMTIAGVGFSHSLVIGLVIGLLNIVPYLGPIIGGTIGILLGIATHLELPLYTELLPMIGYMVIVVLITQVVDNILFQPLIFSSSVRAHPLEIFLVILMAGSLAGIPGMILAIPTYTVIRVFAKEFFSEFRVVKKLTEKI